MAVDVSCRLIFLASPGGLADERAACRHVVRHFHETNTLKTAATFVVHAWEDIPGGVGRPQDRINPSLDDCDFAIFIFGDSWGSPPSTTGPYTSGTEEEFFRALDLLADPERPMRDLLLLFKTLEPDRLRDPGPMLKPVLGFRDRIERSKELMFERFDSTESLGRAISRKLDEWAQPLAAKVARSMQIAADEPDGLRSPDAVSLEQLLESARGHAQKGLLMQAEAAFSHAIASGDPAAILEYAQFMRRTGRLNLAMDLNRQVLGDEHLLASDSVASVRARVSALANIGVIQRKQGDLDESRRSLREAVTTASGHKGDLDSEYCYACDNYGLTLLRQGLNADASSAFGLSYELRKSSGTPKERAQAAINLGHLYIAEDNQVEALRWFDEALTGLKDAPDDHLLANGLCGKAEALLRQGDLSEVEALLTAARDLNDRLQNSDGISIVHGLLARVEIARGNIDAALLQIEQVRAESARSGNRTGAVLSTWLLGEAARQGGDLPAARTYLTDAALEVADLSSPRLEADIAASKARLDEAMRRLASSSD